MAVLAYVQDKFGSKKAKEIYERIEQMLERIASMPELFPTSKKQKGLRKCVFSEQTSIYYRVNEDYIEVISFRANRKDPGQFKS